MQLDHSEGAPHRRVQHDRHCIAKVQKAGFDMLDVMFLRRYFKWGGHVCRLPRERHARWLTRVERMLAGGGAQQKLRSGLPPCRTGTGTVAAGKMPWLEF